MSDTIVEIYTPSGVRVGNFKNPKLEQLSSDHYKISGIFLESSGEIAQRIEFNPEMLPYTADISKISGCQHKKLIRVYVQKGWQPIQMIGVGIN